MSRFSNFKKDPQAYLYSHSLPIQYLFWRHDWPSCDACYAITIFLLFCLSGVLQRWFQIWLFRSVRFWSCLWWTSPSVQQACEPFSRQMLILLSLAKLTNMLGSSQGYDKHVR